MSSTPIARSSRGASLQVSTDGGVTWIAVAQLRTVTPSGKRTEIIDQTNLSTPGTAKIKLAAQVDSGDVAYDGVLFPTDAGLNLLSSLQDALTLANFRIVLPVDAAMHYLQTAPAALGVRGPVWSATFLYNPGFEIVDPAGHVQQALTAFVSGTVEPSWNDSGGFTEDGPQANITSIGNGVGYFVTQVIADFASGPAFQLRESIAIRGTGYYDGDFPITAVTPTSVTFIDPGLTNPEPAISTGTISGSIAWKDLGPAAGVYPVNLELVSPPSDFIDDLLDLPDNPRFAIVRSSPTASFNGGPFEVLEFGNMNGSSSSFSLLYLQAGTLGEGFSTAGTLVDIYRLASPTVYSFQGFVSEHVPAKLAIGKLCTFSGKIEISGPITTVLGDAWGSSSGGPDLSSLADDWLDPVWSTYAVSSLVPPTAEAIKAIGGSAGIALELTAGATYYIVKYDSGPGAITVTYGGATIYELLEQYHFVLLSWDGAEFLKIGGN